MDSPTISVAIATVGREQELRRAADSVLRQLGATDEVIVVTQGAAARVRESSDERVRFLHLAESNASAARNAAIAVAARSVVLFIDDDAEALPGLVEAHRRAYRRAGVVAVGGRVLFPGCDANRPAPLAPGVDGTAIDAPVCYSTTRVGQPLHVISCNLSARRDALFAVGGFDERYVVYGEDRDLVARLRSIGEVEYEPSAVVVHHQYASRSRPTLGALWRREFNQHLSALRGVGVRGWLAWRVRRMTGARPAAASGASRPPSRQTSIAGRCLRVFCTAVSWLPALVAYRAAPVGGQLRDEAAQDG